MARRGVDLGGRRLRRLHDAVTPPSFGKRGLTSAPFPAPAPAPRRLRSRIVVIAGAGALALGVAAAASEWRSQRCAPRAPGDPDRRPDWCDRHSSSSGGHGWGFAGGGARGAGASVGHGSFGGFGATGAGHGGGS